MSRAGAPPTRSRHTGAQSRRLHRHPSRIRIRLGRRERTRRLRAHRGRRRRQAHRAVRPHLFLGARGHDLSVVPEGRCVEIPGDHARPADHLRQARHRRRRADEAGTGMPYGSYRLTITDPKSGAASSYRFYSGWAASSEGDRPDRIPVAADKPAYASARRRMSRSSRRRTARRWSSWPATRCSRPGDRCPGGRHERGHSGLRRLGRRAPMCWSPIIGRSTIPRAHEPVRAIGVAWLQRRQQRAR
jgi:hypothetical protein